MLATLSLGHAATPAAVERKVQPRPARDTLPFGVFGSLEFATNAAKGLGEWKRVTAKVDAERALYEACDLGGKGCPSNLEAWRGAIKQWSALAPLARLIAVNAYVNGHIRYADDSMIYGRADVWASPSRALGGRGDCEDYAIAKYESLRALGFAERDLRIVVLKDLHRKLGHAVLSVRLGQNLYILDNQKARPFLHDTVAYYAPVFSINREGRWINIATRKIRAEYAIAVEERGNDAAAAARAKLAEKPRRKAKRVAAMVGVSDAAGAADAPQAGGLPAPVKKSAPPVKDGARELP
ncbi:transglutaminase-like cysteine peptidase [Taklimakanibacter deserti]|uniref:transglutaminase-like cysteine peptidase n=1 Tax=Taklimakanibacter deserti TaxID=2267839 RepID=UPI000E659D92